MRRIHLSYRSFGLFWRLRWWYVSYPLCVVFLRQFVMSDLNVAGDALWKYLESQAGPFPESLKRILMITKYDTLYDVAHLSKEDTEKIEKFMQETLPLLIMEDDREQYYGPFKSIPEKFKFFSVDLNILEDMKSYAAKIYEMKLKSTSTGTTCVKKNPDMIENINDGCNYEPVIVESGHLEAKLNKNLSWLSVAEATVALVKPDNDHILPWIRSQIRGVIVSQALPIKDFERSTRRYRAIGNCFEWSALDYKSGFFLHFRLHLSSPVSANLFSRKFDELVAEFRQADPMSMYKQRLELDTKMCRKCLVGKHEKLLFCERAKLFVRGDEWQECAVGEVGISHKSDLNRTRLVFVAYHVYKVVLDCVLTAVSPTFRIRLPLAAGILWTGVNHARNTNGENESFAIRFNENAKQRSFLRTLATYLEESVLSGNDSEIVMIVDLSETLFREEAYCEIRKGTGEWSPRVLSQVFLFLDYHNEVCSIVIRRPDGPYFRKTTVVVTPNSGEYTISKKCFEWISRGKNSGMDLKIYFSSQASALSFLSTFEESYGSVW